MSEESAVAVVEPQQGLMIFGTSSPTGIINKATAIANALAPLIEKKHLYVTVNGRKHVYVEGWNTMLAMIGVFPYSEYSRKIGDAPLAYESRVRLKHVSGIEVGAGEALCSADEKNWAQKDEFQLKSMAQTRATGKAARLSFSWIMGLAGYDVTPAEEMGDEKAEPIKGPEAKTEAKESAASEIGGKFTFIPKVATRKDDKNGKPRYAAKLPNEEWAGTYNEENGELLLVAKENKFPVTVVTQLQGQFVNIVSVEKA